MEMLCRQKSVEDEAILKELDIRMGDTRKWLENTVGTRTKLAPRSELQSIGRPLDNLPIRAEEV